jgi:Ca2+-binding RTX toxin-like protein
MRRLSLFTVLVLAALAAPAQAATVSVQASSKKIRFTAAAAELNRLSITQEVTQAGTSVHFVDRGIGGVTDEGAVRSSRSVPACSKPAPNAVTCTVPDGWRVQAETGDLGDEVRVVATTLGVRLRGGVGNDLLAGGDGVDDVQGEEGNDTLDGGIGSDRLGGGTGDDAIHARDAVRDAISCGDGADSGEADLEDQDAGDCETLARPLAPPTVGEPAPAAAPVVEETPAPVAKAKPAPGVSVAAGVKRGRVLVKAPGGRYRPLDPAAPVPVGATLDTRAGVVTLTSASNRSGATQTADFTGGRFTVSQTRGKALTTVLTLRGKLDCSRSRQVNTGARAAAARRSTRARRLWGSGHGRFTTRGRNGQATVRGTIWSVEDRCDRTVTHVERGAVSVRDFGLHRTRLVRAGGRYVARKRAKPAR